MKRMMLHACAPPLQLIGKIRRHMLMENRSETSALEKQGKLQSHEIPILRELELCGHPVSMKKHTGMI